MKNSLIFIEEPKFEFILKETSKANIEVFDIIGKVLNSKTIIL